MSHHSTLNTASNDRKIRLAELNSLKRKEAPTLHDDESRHDDEHEQGSGTIHKRKSQSRSVSTSSLILSGRNYDFATGAKLGFELDPANGQLTIERQAEDIAMEVKEAQQEDEEMDKPLDLFKLQPKKPNWDLKRDVNKKLEILNARTDNAIARIVRDRIQKTRSQAQASGDTTERLEMGMDGNALLEAMHMREREEADDERKSREMDDLP